MTSIDNVTVISSFDAETVNVSCMYFYEYPENPSFDFITYNCQRPTFLGYVAQEFILYNHFITFTYYNTVLSYLLNNISRYIIMFNHWLHSYYLPLSLHCTLFSQNFCLYIVPFFSNVECKPLISFTLSFKNNNKKQILNTWFY